MVNKIGIILTTFNRDFLLEKSVKSIEENWNDVFQLIILDQNPSLEKLNKYKKHIYEAVPFDCGLSYSRNIGVDIATRLDIPFVIITADSICFNNTTKILVDNAGNLMANHDIVGLHLNNRIEWEGWLNLIPEKSFEIDFIEKNKQTEFLTVWDCNIVRNFFLAKTELLRIVKWDNNLKMAEHEDFFWRIKERMGKVGCTKDITGEYIGERTAEFQKFRDTNFQTGLKTLREKYKISGWVSYKNIDRIRRK